VNVGSIVVIGGEGELKMSSDPKIDELLLPVDFPEVANDTTVEIVGLVSGTFQSVAVL